MQAGRVLALVATVGTLAACHRPLNYRDTWGPRYAGTGPSRAVAGSEPGTLRLVTFNIQFAKHVDSAIAVLQSAPALQHADVIALQEMDAPGTQAVARALGMWYVYYPATVHPSTGRDFGNAVLSRRPIVEDHKVILPHLARFGGTQRIATAATILVAGTSVCVYSVHLGTQVEEGPGARRDQVHAVLADAAGCARVVVSGDMNSHGAGKELRAAGFLWPTERNPRTTRFGNWDHVFLKGLSVAPAPAAGVVTERRHSSDHRPVWVLATVDPD